MYVQVDRLSITLEPRLGAAVRKAAKRAGLSVSAWIAEATAARIRNLALRDALDAWDKEDRPLTTDRWRQPPRRSGCWVHVRRVVDEGGARRRRFRRSGKA